jgi:hypothetical protein
MACEAGTGFFYNVSLHRRPGPLFMEIWLPQRFEF